MLKYMPLEEMTAGVARQDVDSQHLPGREPGRTVGVGGYRHAGQRSPYPGSRRIAFGRDARPYAIVLTHGHRDHSGSARELAKEWDVPVYAHRLERPFLTGKSTYPPKEPLAGGAFAFLSRFFPMQAPDLGDRLHDLPEGGKCPA